MRVRGRGGTQRVPAVPALWVFPSHLRDEALSITQKSSRKPGAPWARFREECFGHLAARIADPAEVEAERQGREVSG